MMFMTLSSPAHGVTGDKISSYTGAAAGVVMDFSGDCKCRLVNRIPRRKPIMNIKIENTNRDTVREGTSISEFSLGAESDVLIARKEIKKKNLMWTRIFSIKNKSVHSTLLVLVVVCVLLES